MPQAWAAANYRLKVSIVRSSLNQSELHQLSVPDDDDDDDDDVWRCKILDMEI